MDHKLMKLSVLFSAFMLVASGSWWVWHTYYSGDQFRAAMANGVESGDFKKAEILYAWGADGRTWFKEDMLKQLMDAGADDYSGRAHYGWALVGWGIQVQRRRWIIDADAVVPGSGLPRVQGISVPLHFAAGLGFFDDVQTLLAMGANVDEKNNCGYSPLAYASLMGNVEVVRTLLTAGADINIKTARGYTALHVAATSGHLEIVQLLLAAGADASGNNSEKQTLWAAAAGNGHNKIAEFLKAHVAKQKQTSLSVKE